VVTALSVDSVTGFTAGDLVVLDDEVIEISAVDAGAVPFPLLFIAARGVDSTAEFGNTSPQSHAENTEVQLYSSMIFNTRYFAIQENIPQPLIINKDRTAPVFVLKDNNGNSIGGQVDVTLTVLPEQYMDNTNLGVR